MPKEESEKTEEKTEEKTIEQEIEEAPEKREESELEQEIEDVGIQSLDFSQFIQPSIEGSSPVLERITGPETPGFSLSGWEVLSSPVTSDGTIKEDDPSKYSVGGGGEEEGKAKYISSEQMAAAPTRVDFSRVGREQIITPNVNQEAFISQASEMRNTESSNLEKYEAAKRMDVESAGREDPFKREVKKYDPSLPGS